MMRMRWFTLAALGAIVLLAAGAFAAEEIKELEVGKKAPAFKLRGVDEKQYALADAIEKNKAVVVVFTCNACPVAVAYQDRLIAIQKDYKDKGVQVIAINPNDPKIVPGDSSTSPTSTMRRRRSPAGTAPWPRRTSSS